MFWNFIVMPSVWVFLHVLRWAFHWWAQLESLCLVLLEKEVFKITFRVIPSCLFSFRSSYYSYVESPGLTFFSAKVFIIMSFCSVLCIFCHFHTVSRNNNDKYMCQSSVFNWTLNPLYCRWGSYCMNTDGLWDKHQISFCYSDSPTYGNGFLFFF